MATIKISRLCDVIKLTNQYRATGGVPKFQVLSGSIGGYLVVKNEDGIPIKFRFTHEITNELKPILTHFSGHFHVINSIPELIELEFVHIHGNYKHPKTKLMDMGWLLTSTGIAVNEFYPDTTCLYDHKTGEIKVSTKY